MTLAAVQDPTFLNLVDRVTARPGTEAGYAAEERPTIVAIKTARGTFESTLRKSAGSADDVSREQVVRKFRSNARLVLQDKNVEGVIDLILGLEESDPRAVAKLLGP